MNKCKCCDGVLHPEELISVNKNPHSYGDYVLYVVNKDRNELLVIGKKINYCPICGRELETKETKC